MHFKLPEISPVTLFETQLRAAGSTMRDKDVIEVSDLRVKAFVGLFEHEKATRQRLRFDIEVLTVPNYSAVRRETGEYVCYGAIVDFITEMAARETHVDMLETWAEDVAQFVLDNPLTDAVSVAVKKLDVFDHAGGVGVRILRLRDSMQ